MWDAPDATNSADRDKDDTKMWQDNWDDDDIEDDFTSVLRKELEAAKGSSSGSGN